MTAMSSTNTSLMRNTILIVDDDPDIRSMLVDALDDEGFAVAAIDNGSDAVASLRDCQPALVLLDLRLPKIGGEHVLDVVHALYGGAVPVITMTGLELSADAMQRRGASAHLRKPFKLEDLLCAVHACL
jgi:DNA-binding response OmpR family regulator